MYRGKVVKYVAHIPMQIKLQREGNKIVALLPAYRLPTGLIVEADGIEEAIEALRKRVHEYWRGCP